MNRKEIIQKIADKIKTGNVVKIHKIKNAIYGGKHWVSVGEYNVVGDSFKMYAVVSTGKNPLANWVSSRSSSPIQAAQEFVRFVGNEKAKESLCGKIQ